MKYFNEEEGRTMTWREFLKMRRKDMGLTKADVAKAVGITYPTITNWESGKVYEPTFFVFMRVLRYLAIPPTDILYLWERKRRIQGE